MGHQSVTKLSKSLVEYGAATATFGAKRLADWNKGNAEPPPLAKGFSLSDETYGRKSFVYIQTPDKPGRKRLERFLAGKGFKINTDYWPKSSTAEVQVSYFKGWHHDE